MNESSHTKLFGKMNLPNARGLRDVASSMKLLTVCRWTPALVVLIFALQSTTAAVPPIESAIGIVALSCPGPDSDGDGVGDACDNCPNTSGESLTFAQNVFAPIPEPALLSTCGTVTTSLSQTIPVNHPGTVVGVRVSVNLQHEVYSDLDIKLVHAGTVVTLNPVSSTSQIRNTSDLNGTYRFDDAVGVPLESAANECFIFDCPTVAPGIYRPSELLNALEGTTASGDWTLIVSDGCRFGNTTAGTFNSWSLELMVAYPDQFDFDGDGVGDVCDNCPASSFSTEGMDEVFAPIPDGVPGTCYFPTTNITRTITISESGPVAFMEATLELDHTWYEDLDVELEHNGTVVTLMSRDQVPPDISSNLGGTYTFAEFAAQTLDEAALICLITGCPIIPNGAYRSDEPLSAFYGMDAKGDWTLTIRDTCFQDSGFLYLWTLSLFVEDASQTDTDGDGMGDACDLCASGARNGDTEADGDFDLFDYQMMASCLHGVMGSLPSGCECFDFDADGDVDLKDASNLALDYQPEPGCLINGVFYQPGQSDAPPFACRTCQPHINRKDWTMAGAGTSCRPAAGSCDIAEVCTGTSTSCPQNVIQPNNFVCRPATGGCDIQEVCAGTSAACPPDVLRPNNHQCRPAAGVCDLAEVCNGTSAACPSDSFQPSSFVCLNETGPNGQYLCQNNVYCSGASANCPLAIISYDPTRICRSSTAPCDPPEYCAGGGVCAPDVRWSAGQVCPGAADCEFPYTCDVAGGCNFNGYRSGTASCRAPSNGCDERDYCGSCTNGNCSTPFPPGDPRHRIDFTDYPECGPDKKKPDGTTCAVGVLAGTCFSGECVTITSCKHNINCPDGYVCNGGNCVAAPVDHGYGDECIGKRVCDASSVTPGAICTFSVDCRDATHPNGNCVSGFRGDCVGESNGRDLVCCASMGGDGLGFAAAPGQKGRCQECCATDYNDVTVTGCGDFECCDGKCSDTQADPHHCGGCAYNGGVDCDDLVTACTPAVDECSEGSCAMASACYDPSDPYSIYDQCFMNGSYRVPDPRCNFCQPALTPDSALHNIGCYGDADCGGIPGSCLIVNGRCSPDSAHAYEICDPTSPVGNAQCWNATNTSGSCVGTCQWPAIINGIPQFVHTYDMIINTDACETPPYTGCSVSCRRDLALCQNNDDPNDILPANYGAECNSDSDCHCGLTCQSSCEFTSGGNPIYFCFSPDTCE